MRFINAIYTANTGDYFDNQTLLNQYQQAIKRLTLPTQECEKLLKSVGYFLMGQRARYTVPNLFFLQQFADRAKAFEQGAERLLDDLTQQITPIAGSNNIVFDAIITTTTTGNLMPGLSYRLAARLPQHVRPDSMLLDLGNVGCTGGLKALNLVNQLGPASKQILVVSAELPTTLINCASTELDVWQANCTFGDGAAALWISSDPTQGDMALKLDQTRYHHYAAGGLDTIYWGYSQDYYTFKLADEQSFEQDVKAYVLQALQSMDRAHLESPYWAIHPAGIALLTRLRRKLGMAKDALAPSVSHYEKYSNMSSAGILHILKDVASQAPLRTLINMFTMGAGFNVIHSTLVKER